MTPDKVLPPGEDGTLRLLRSLSHDLRSPLAAITALIQMMQSESDGPLSEGHQTRLRKLSEAAGRLTALSTHLSDLALIHAGRMSLSPSALHLHEAADLAMKRIEPLATARAIELRMHLPANLPPLTADLHRLAQSFELLLRGAVRQIEGSVLVLSATSRRGRMEIAIREEPRGLPTEALSGVEAPLVREDTLDGTLGAAVAGELLRLHGGRLLLGADAGGRLAVIDLPLAAGPAASRARTSPQRRPRP